MIELLRQALSVRAKNGAFPGIVGGIILIPN
jgi:hypothetical protein